jgi:predicted site-specific integrase-resolvase
VPSGLLTVAEAARALHFSTRSVRRYAARGELDAVQVVPNGELRIWADSVTSLLARDYRPRAESEAA